MQVELLLSLLFILPTIGGAAAVLQASWNRTHCAILVFETSRKALEESPVPFQSVHLIRTSRSVHGQKKCGDAFEVIGFKKI